MIKHTNKKTIDVITLSFADANNRVFVMSLQINDENEAALLVVCELFLSLVQHMKLCQ